MGQCSPPLPFHLQVKKLYVGWSKFGGCGALVLFWYFFFGAELFISLGEDCSFFLKRIIAKIIDYLLETAFTILAMLQFIYRIFMKRGKLIISQKSKYQNTQIPSVHIHIYFYGLRLILLLLLSNCTVCFLLSTLSVLSLILISFITNSL